MTDYKTWKFIKASLVEDLLRVSEKEGELVGKSFVRNLDKLGDKVLTQTFSPSEISRLRQLGRIGESIQKRVGGEGTVFFQLAQAGGLAQVVGATGAAIGLGTGQEGLTGAGALLILSPPILARLMLNPTFAKLVAEGFSLPAKSPQALGLVNRLTIAGSRINNDLQAEKRNNKLEAQSLLKGE